MPRKNMFGCPFPSEARYEVRQYDENGRLCAIHPYTLQSRQKAELAFFNPSSMGYWPYISRNDLVRFFSSPSDTRKSPGFVVLRTVMDRDNRIKKVIKNPKI